MRTVSVAPMAAPSVPLSTGVVSSVVVPLAKLPCTMPVSSVKLAMAVVCAGGVVSTVSVRPADAVPRLPAASVTTAV
jgi:hypothetical protein